MRHTDFLESHQQRRHPIDNLMVDCTHDGEGNNIVTDVASGDFDIACTLKAGESRITPHAMGNAMWRSPEGQSGISSKASDVHGVDRA